VFPLSTWSRSDRTALRFAGSSDTVSYRELTARVGSRREEIASSKADRFHPLTTSLDLSSIVDLVAHFVAGLPVLLVDSRLPPLDREMLIREADAARPELGDQVVLGTSGSTGRPKLVVHTQQSLICAARASEENLGWLPEGDRWYLSLPLSHIGGLALLIRCLLATQTVVVGRARSSDPEAVLSELVSERVTLASFVPTQLTRLVRIWPAQKPMALRAVLLGGAPISRTLRETAEGLGVRTISTYGMTEMSSQVATERFVRNGPSDFEEGKVGPPLAGVEVEVNADGRLRIRGPMAMRGYLNAPSPFDGNGFFVTSDLGKVDSRGTVYVHGRVDNMIITGGENVAAEAVEAALLNLPGVREACALGVPDLDWGARVVAVVTLTDGVVMHPDEVRIQVAEHLPAFARPKEVRIVPALPWLPLGKVDRRAVLSMFTR
jgi:o-succinylbenzoate---CoA ligase